MKTIEEIRGRCVITEDGHWLWKGTKRPDGRPNIWAPDYTHGGEMRTQCGTRTVWHCKTGRAVPAGWRCYGTCEEMSCCNPAHIRCTSEEDFGAWLQASGRYQGQIQRILANRAIGRARAAVTPEQIQYIQASAKTGVALALELGVSDSTVSKYRRGESIVIPSGMFSGLGARTGGAP
ncbi:hypothetical protein [Paracidovorax oryzae]|uniref:hypothetical protein n=1 Tax=Paracidovorax oryzae TaxID=862720 RepID=UPI0002EDD311|nr:hypothetical protein [Paracidovorax oryzae]